MELDGHPREYRGKFRRKGATWYCQKKYHDSHSHISYQPSLTAASYKRKIKSILNNNKSLAQSLQNCKCELADKENMIVEHAKNLDLISFSRLKLQDMAENLKKVSTSLDETLSLLQLHAATSPSQSIQSDLATKSNFKKRLETLVSEPIEEVIESSGYETNLSTEANQKENKVPAMDDKPMAEIFKGNHAALGNKCTSLAPGISKKNKPALKERSRPRKMKEPKVKLSRNISVRSFMPSDETPSYLHGLDTDSESMINLREDIAATVKETKTFSMSQKKNFLNGLSPKLHYSNMMLSYGDIQEKEGEASHKKNVFILQDAIDNVSDANAFKNTKLSPKVDKQISFKNAIMIISPSKSNQKSKFSPKNVLVTNEDSRCTFVEPTNAAFNLEELEKETLIATPKVDIYSENSGNVDVAKKTKGILKHNIDIKKQPMCNKPLSLNKDTSNAPPLEITADTRNVNTGNAFSNFNISSDIYSNINSTQPKVVLKRTTSLIKEKCITISNNSSDTQNSVGKLSNSSKKANVKQSETQTFRRKGRVQFYFENEEKIEQLSEGKFIKTRNSKKRPLRENTQNIPSELTVAVPPKKKTLSPYVPDTLALSQGSNTFIVTAEVHQPPDGYMSEKSLDERNMQPSVVLTDIFRSTNLSRNFLSSVKSIKISENTFSKKGLKSDMNYQNNEENENSAGNQLMEDETSLGRRRSKVTTYKEPSLNIKMRRCR